jgi:O-antigen/teichoic acid export membrane protein
MFNPRPRLETLVRKVLLTGGAQALVQLLSFVGGILVVRLLAPEQYAYYTIANAALSSMTVLADSGIGTGVLAQGGKVWHERKAFGAVLATGLALRRQFAFYAALVSIPIACVLLLRQGADWSAVALLSAVVLPQFLLAISGQLLEIVPRLHQELAPLQRVQVAANAARVALLGIALPLWPAAFTALSVAIVPQAWTNWRLRQLAAKHVDWQTVSVPEVRRQIVGQVKRMLPNTLFYVFSGQITVWLIAVFGETTAVAAVGALGRIGMALGLLGTIFGLVAIPRFARIPTHDSRRVWRRYWQAQAALLIACASVTIAIAAFPELVLAILGPSYRDLTYEVVLMGAGAGFGVLFGAAFGLGAARAVVAPPWLVLPYCLGIQALLVYVLPVGTVAGVIWLGLASFASQWLMHAAYFAYAQYPRRRAAT